MIEDGGLREALEVAAGDLREIASWSLSWNSKPQKARQAERALKRVEAAIAAYEKARQENDGWAVKSVAYSMASYAGEDPADEDWEPSGHLLEEAGFIVRRLRRAPVPEQEATERGLRDRIAELEQSVHDVKHGIMDRLAAPVSSSPDEEERVKVQEQKETAGDGENGRSGHHLIEVGVWCSRTELEEAMIPVQEFMDERFPSFAAALGGRFDVG